MAHGLPLKNLEIRFAFYAYLRADRHRDASGKRVQSLREMGREFGKSHHTVHKWMNTREFRADYEAYKTGEVFKDRPPDVAVPPTPTEKAAMNIHEALRQARALYPALDPDQREDLVAELRRTLVAIEAGQSEAGTALLRQALAIYENTLGPNSEEARFVRGYLAKQNE